MEQEKIKRLKRSSKDRVLAGVCGGLGEYFEVDPLIFRLMFVIMVIFAGSGLLLYIILWILIPEENEQRENPKNIAKNIKDGTNKMVQEIKTQSQNEGSARNLIGAVILIIGIIFLLDNFFPWLRVGIDRLWPLVIVAIGAGILLGGNKTRS